jgi:hypothetical protein
MVVSVDDKDITIFAPVLMQLQIIKKYLYLPFPLSQVVSREKKSTYIY